MNLNKEIYTTREVARLLDLSPDAIREAIRAGKLKAEKFSRDYVITRKDLADYLEYRERRDHGKH